MTEKVRAVGYVRVSSKRQAEEGLSLEEQERRVRAHIDAAGLGVRGRVRGAGRQRRRERQGPGRVARLLQNLDGIDRIVIPKLDRLGRPPATCSRSSNGWRPRALRSCQPQTRTSTPASADRAS